MESCHMNKVNIVVFLDIAFTIHYTQHIYNSTCRAEAQSVYSIKGKSLDHELSMA